MPPKPNVLSDQYSVALFDFLFVNVNPIALGQPFQDFGHSVIFSHDPIDPTGAKVRIKK